jgi:Family of unknown function (DUF6263)
MSTILNSIGAIALTALPCIASEPVVLQYKFNQDAPVRYETAQVMSQNQTIQGQLMESQSTTSGVMTTELLETMKDGSVLIANTTDSMSVSITAPGVDLSYDSTDAKDASKLSDPTISSIAGTVGMQIQLLLGTDGTILDVPNMDSLAKRVEGIEDPTIRSSVSLMLQKESIIAGNEMNYKLLPSGAVETGDIWKREFIVPFAFGSMKTSFDLSLDDVADGIATITFTGSMNMEPITQQGVTIKLGDTEVKGTLMFNIEDGLAESYQLTNVVNMVGTMEGMAEPILTMVMMQDVSNTRIKN